MQHMKNKNGFTIIELIMVMIIIGVLAAVAIPRFQDIVIESEVAVEQRIIQTIHDGLETYAREMYVSNGVRSWPENPFAVCFHLGRWAGEACGISPKTDEKSSKI